MTDEIESNSAEVDAAVMVGEIQGIPGGQD